MCCCRGGVWLWWQRWVSFVWIFAVAWWRCHGGVSSCGGKGGFHLFGFLPWGGGVAVGFSLGMLFVVVVVVANYFSLGMLFVVVVVVADYLSLGMLFVVVGWWYVVCCFYLDFDIYDFIM